MPLDISNSEDGELNPQTTKYLMNTYGVSYGDAPTLANLYRMLQTMNTDYAGDGGGQIGVTEQRMDEILRQVAPQLGKVSAQEAFTSALNPAEKQQYDYIKRFTEQQRPDLLSYAPLAGMAAVGAAGLGAFPGLGGAEALGGASALPESYWSMLADAGGAGVPSAAAGTVGGGLSAADIAGLTQMGQAAGLSGDALASFVAQGGSAAGVGTGAASGLGNLLTPNPASVATNAAGQLGGGDGLGGLGTDEAGAVGGNGELPTGTGSGSLWGNLLSSIATPQGATALGGILSGLLGSLAQSNAASNASDAQSAAAQAGIAEQRRQFDAVRALLQPYVSAGTGALTGQQNLLGLNGAAAQQGAYDMVNNSPAMTSLTQTGENAILQNASATGGLRGGNTQAALAQFRPALLSQLIQNQFQNLGGLTSVGANAAAGTGNAGMQTGNNVSNLLQQQGAAQAGNALAQGRAQTNALGALGGGLGLFAGMGGFNNLFG